MRSLTTRFEAEEEISYDGLSLAPHWIYKKFNIVGDALISFIGSAEVSLDHMVDLQDVKESAPIYSPKMLHFLGEFFEEGFQNGIHFQHLLIRTIYETLWEKGIQQLHRKGDDIFYEDRKLSVSIATRSAVSNLIHVGLNIETAGTPVTTAGLSEMKLDPKRFGAEILEKFRSDFHTLEVARAKVLPRI